MNSHLTYALYVAPQSQKQALNIRLFKLQPRKIQYEMSTTVASYNQIGFGKVQCDSNLIIQSSDSTYITSKTTGEIKMRELNGEKTNKNENPDAGSTTRDENRERMIE